MTVLKQAVSNFYQDGFAVVPLYSAEETKIISEFATAWLYRLLTPWVSKTFDQLPLKHYHIWSREITSDHRQAFGSKNRYLYPELSIRKTILNNKVNVWLGEIGLKKYKVWDDGWGDVGFRLIRPGCQDGYPLCCKNWGKANGVTSFWIPIIGHSENETLLLAKGSHLKEHPKQFVEGKFYANEPRYCGKLSDLELVRPTLQQGDVICYHGATLHSEDVEHSDITRVNLEIRFLPD